MLDPSPTWAFESKEPLTKWYGHVHLLADHVVGQWLCVERKSGELLWQTRQHRANTICGFDSGVIVEDYKEPSSIGWKFYNTGIEKDRPRVSVGEGLFLRHAQEKGGMQRGVFKIAAETESGVSVWRLTIDQLGRHIDGNFFSYRLFPPYIYLVVSDQSRWKPHPSEKHVVLPNPTRWHLVTLDLPTGEVLQDFSLGDELLEECRIEDVDVDGLLIGKSNRGLKWTPIFGPPR